MPIYEPGLDALVAEKRPAEPPILPHGVRRGGGPGRCRLYRRRHRPPAEATASPT